MPKTLPVPIRDHNNFQNFSYPTHPAWPFYSVTVDRDSYNSDFKDFETAVKTLVAARAKNVVIEVGGGIYNVNKRLWLPRGICIRGQSWLETKIAINGVFGLTMEFSDEFKAAFVEDIWIEAVSALTLNAGIYISGVVGSKLICRNAKFTCPATGGSAAYAIDLDINGDLELHDCECLASISGGGTIAGGVSNFATGNVYIYGGRLRGTGGTSGYGLYSPSIGSAFLYQLPRMSGSTGPWTVGGSITWEWYQDDSGNLVARQTDPPTHRHSQLWESDGGAVALSADAAGASILQSTQPLKAKSSNFPTLGTTTLAEKLGHIYLGTAKDVFPYDDAFALFNRVVNWGQSPQEHWAQGADQVTWTGWAAYTGWITPNNLLRTLSRFFVNDYTGSANGRSFYYKTPALVAAAFPQYVYCRTGVTYVCAAGIMLDDGVNNADGNGANNFVRLYLENTVATGGVVVTIQRRTGGGGVTTVTGPTLNPGQTYGLNFAVTGTKWSNWTVYSGFLGEIGSPSLVDTASGLTWTPARVGPFYRNTGADGGRLGIFDWFAEV